MSLDLRGSTPILGTETIRTVSKDSCAFVRAMENAECSTQERLNLLRKACASHPTQPRMHGWQRSGPPSLRPLHPQPRLLYIQSLFGLLHLSALDALH
ncbi:hypothetical protein L596_020860 [Steinernema carpocapsae]|uniref:Choline/carnitine acyltransferase domain-containing protein n=1 Tax=Steinernema carpocapsae TaxID=34508 RepID=A0A4U5MVF1_STECR|nr:hypothetical protein L596_020860 [Steinernema carpocapsae]